MTKNDPWPEFISLAEAGRMTSYSSRTIRRKVTTGELTAYTMGGTRSYRVRRDDVLALMTPCQALHIDDETAEDEQ